MPPSFRPAGVRGVGAEPPNLDMPVPGDRNPPDNGVLLGKPFNGASE